MLDRATGLGQQGIDLGPKGPAGLFPGLRKLGHSGCVAQPGQIDRSKDGQIGGSRSADETSAPPLTEVAQLAVGRPQFSPKYCD